MATQPNPLDQIAELKARIEALEKGQPVADPPPPPAPKTENLTFSEATRFVRQGKKISRATSPWKGTAYLYDAGILPHWGLVINGRAPIAWPEAMSMAQARLDLAANDWYVVQE